MSIRPAYPSIRPSLLLDFANAQVLDPRVTFTRASTATYYDAEGVLRTAASGQARFTFDPVTEESLGLLIEESRTNLLLRSEEFQTTWTIVGTASVVANGIAAPDGATTADKFVLGNTVTSGNAALSQSATKPAVSADYTVSLYVKAGEFNSLRVILRDAASASNFVQAYFNLATGVIAQAANAGGTFTAASATITDVGNSWYRVSVTGTSSTETSLNVRLLSYQNGTGTATGDGTSGIYLWGAQLEAGSFATSYIPTVASQVTRAVDAASMTGANFSSWYDNAEGTLYGELSVLALRSDGSVSSALRVDDGTASNRYVLRFGTVITGADFFVNVNGSSVVDTNSVGVTANVNAKYSYAYKVNDFAFTQNAASPFTDTLGVLPSVNTLTFAGDFFNGTIKKIAYYPVRLTNAQLQALTI